MRAAKKVRPYLWITPALLLLTIFNIYPFLTTIVSSAFIIDRFGKLKQFVGLDNYLYLLSNKAFLQSIRNSLVFTAISVPLSKVISLLLAALACNRRKLSWFYESAFSISMAVSASVIAIVFKVMYNPSAGCINAILQLNINWLNDRRFALLAIIIIAVWRSIGYDFLFLLAAIRGIPEEVIESANLDGITVLGKIWKIYLPLVAPIMFFLICTDIVSSIMMMVYVDVLTEGGPMNSTATLLEFMYTQGFGTGNFTIAYPVAVVAFVITAIATVISFLVEKRKVQY